MSENQDSCRRAIKENARTLRKRLAGGMLYGIPIDPGDADMMIVAAWAIGAFCEREKLGLHDAWAKIPDFTKAPPVPLDGGGMVAPMPYDLREHGISHTGGVGCMVCCDAADAREADRKRLEEYERRPPIVANGNEAVERLAEALEAAAKACRRTIVPSP